MRGELLNNLANRVCRGVRPDDRIRPLSGGEKLTRFIAGVRQRYDAVSDMRNVGTVLIEVGLRGVAVTLEEINSAAKDRRYLSKWNRRKGVGNRQLHTVPKFADEGRTRLLGLAGH